MDTYDFPQNGKLLLPLTTFSVNRPWCLRRSFEYIGLAWGNYPSFLAEVESRMAGNLLPTAIRSITQITR